jgi:5-methylcytosine-specific restriction endonuclease McrA
MSKLVGHKVSMETKNKIRLKLTGKKLTKETIEKLKTIHKRIGISQEQRIRMKENIRRGEDCWNWKGGITPFRELLRNSNEYKHWREEVFIRNNWVCQSCGANKQYLEVHHIKPFSMLVDEFLAQYSQFSPIEDKETLIRLAMNYQPFWEVNNGITYCKKCHDEINHYWVIPNMRNVNNRLLKNAAKS